MAADKKIQPIVVKRIKKAAHGHHGGAWKIAYADFVTAMMAFFLLMWLLGSTTQGDLKGISDYFSSPLQIALSGGRGSGDATSLIQGGGTDLSRSSGQRNLDTASSRRQKKLNMKSAREQLIRDERDRLAKLRGSIEEMILKMPGLSEFKDQIRLDLTADGLSIQIVDAQSRPMFTSGSAVVQPYMRELLRNIGKLLNEVENPVSLTGHTDAALYSGGNRGYSNWELSADRANASRRELVAGGLKDGKVLRVTGVGSVVPLDASHPLDPMNRRIAIVVLNTLAQERILRGSEVSADEEAEVSKAIGASGQASTGSKDAGGAAEEPKPGDRQASADAGKDGAGSAKPARDTKSRKQHE
ncbi:MAG: flagellar motor protein MotB [Lautropia sp.]